MNQLVFHGMSQGFFCKNISLWCIEKTIWWFQTLALAQGLTRRSEAVLTDPLAVFHAMDCFVDWSKLQYGDSIDVVVKVLVASPNKIWCYTVNQPSQNLVLLGDFNPDSIGSLVTVVAGKVVDLKSPFRIEVGQSSGFFPLKACEKRCLMQIVELCSGAGFFSSIAAELGMSVLVGVDQNHRWKSLFESLHDHSQFMCGTCGDPTLVSRLFGLGAAHCILVAGVSCQPHSVGGDARGFLDPRALCLPAVLRTSWLLQAPVTVLECVPGVLNDADFQGLLRHFCRCTGAVLSQSVLRLSDSWCAFRDRWFCVIAAPCFGEIHIPSMPVRENFQKVHQVMPSLFQMHSSDFEQLHLTLYELSKFYTFAHGGIQSHFLHGDMKLPTVLHSAANQLYPCRCGCRRPFTLERLQARGLFGTLVPLGVQICHDNQMMQDCRYLHPFEMALLNGGSVGFDVGDDLRLTLSAIGQSVSPLQGLWVMAHVLQRLQCFFGVEPVSPTACFDMFVDKILASRDETWGPSVSAPIPPPQCQYDVEMADEVDGNVLSFRVGAKTTVSDFQTCHRQLTGRLSPSLQVFSGDVHLADDTLLAGQTQLHFGFFPEPLKIVDDTHVPCPCGEWCPDTDLLGITPTVSFTLDPSVVASQEVGSFDAIACLPAAGLVALLKPQVQTDTAVRALIGQQIPKVMRCSVLDNQHGLWADDEIRFFLQQQVVHFSDQAVVMWDPLLLSSVIRFGNFDVVKALASSLISPAVVVTSVLVDEHWYPVVWQWTDGDLHAFTCGHAFGRSMAVSKLHLLVCETLGCDCHPVNFRSLGFAVDDFCGAMAVAFCDHLLSGEPLPSSLADLTSIHHWYRGKFLAGLSDLTPRPWIWGHGESDWRSKLTLLLQDHGVDVEEVEARATHVVSTLGQGSIVKIMNATSPWRELKWAANRCTPCLQLVRPSELQKMVEKRVAEGKPMGNKTQKKAGKGGSKGSVAKTIDPASLRIETGLFVCGEGQQLAQLSLAHITPAASGVVLCNACDAFPYLKGCRQISAGGLALIVLDAVEPLKQTTLVSQKVRLPVLCTSNQEPLLVEGFLYQLGALPVTRADCMNRVELATVATCVTKLLLFRDQVQCEWKDVVAHPMKQVFALLPLLQPCPDSECDGSCEAWHATATFPCSEPILELWGRQWLLDNFTVSPPLKADLFVAHVRLPFCLQHRVQTYSGCNGLFLEPKDEDGKTPSKSYQVIWMGRSSLQDLVICKQSISGITGLARMNGRYGFRCHVDHVAEVYAKVKPNSAFLPQGRKDTYLLGPAPFGTIKSSMVKVLEALAWKARVLHPIPAGAQISGMLWKIQAIEPPPVQIVSSAHGDMVITKCEDPVVQMPSTPAVVAASHTLSLCTANSGNEDPWAHWDPWSQGLKKGAVTTPPVIASHDPVQAIERRVVESVLAQLPKPSMEIDDGSGDVALQTKVQQLESQVQELQAGQQHLHHTLQDTAAQTNCQIQTLHRQTSQLETAVQTNAGQLTAFQTQFHAQMEQSQSRLEGLFKEQHDRIEALFQKRARME